MRPLYALTMRGARQRLPLHPAPDLGELLPETNRMITTHRLEEHLTFRRHVGFVMRQGPCLGEPVPWPSAEVTAAEYPMPPLPVKGAYRTWRRDDLTRKPPKPPKPTRRDRIEARLKAAWFALPHQSLGYEDRGQLRQCVVCGQFFEGGSGAVCAVRTAEAKARQR